MVKAWCSWDQEKINPRQDVLKCHRLPPWTRTTALWIQFTSHKGQQTGDCWRNIASTETRGKQQRVFTNCDKIRAITFVNDYTATFLFQSLCSMSHLQIYGNQFLKVSCQWSESLLSLGYFSVHVYAYLVYFQFTRLTKRNVLWLILNLWARFSE